MTFVELFDEDVLENICACLANNPSRVILLGDKTKLLEKNVKRYQELLESIGITAEFIPKAVDKSNLHDIIKVISEIAEEYDDCVFELTGGGDLYLAAVGVVMERYREKNHKVQQFNPRNGMLYEYDEEYKKGSTRLPLYLSVEENIKLYGGDIIHGLVEGYDTFTEKLSDTDVRDIDAMWDICKRHLKDWNAQAGMLAAANRISASSETTDFLTVHATKAEMQKKLGEQFRLNESLLRDLQRQGLLSDLQIDDDGFAATYKNEHVKNWLTKAGRVLEMKVYLAGLRAMDSDGKHVYHDVRNSVWIDWDGKKEGYNYGTTNEIDVILMHETIPVFISCKNGNVSIDELYKLEAVSEKFGGKYAKKVLIATRLNHNDDCTQKLMQRAKDMHIRVVDNIVGMREDELNDLMCSLWNR